MEVDWHVTFTIPPRGKINPKCFTKITFNKEVRQSLTAAAKITVVVLCYPISKEPFVYRMLWLILIEKLTF